MSPTLTKLAAALELAGWTVHHRVDGLLCASRRDVDFMLDVTEADGQFFCCVENFGAVEASHRFTDFTASNLAQVMQEVERACPSAVVAAAQ